MGVPRQQESVVVLHDVSDNADATGPTQTVRFGLDGQQYEIDLRHENADELRAAFARYIAAGRRVDRQANDAKPTRLGGGGTSRTAPRTTANGHDPAAIREWARAHGHQVSDRGPIPANVRRAYDARKQGGRR